MAEEKKNDGDRGYRVVDRRFDTADGPGAGQAEKEKSESEETGAAGQAQEPAAAQGGDEPGRSASGREARIEDALRLALGVLREQSLFALGLLISRHRAKEPDMERIGHIRNIFNALTDKFADRISDDELRGEGRQEPSLEDIIVFIFNLLQEQVLLHLGLIAHPGTGRVVKDLDQAKLGIDFCAELLENSRPVLDAGLVRRFEGALSDMRINFVGQK